jgi:hypothetical protein
MLKLLRQQFLHAQLFIVVKYNKLTLNDNFVFLIIIFWRFYLLKN